MDDHYLRHSGSMHFSTCSSSSVQSPSSTGDFSIRCRVLSPFPQVTLQSLHSDHGVSMQGIVSTHNTRQKLQQSSNGLFHSAKLFLNLALFSRFGVGGARIVPDHGPVTYGILASCTSPLLAPLLRKWSHQQEASSPSAPSSSFPDHKWRCRHPIHPTP